MKMRDMKEFKIRRTLLQAKQAMIIEEEHSMNLLGSEMVGSIIDIWSNLDRYE